MKNSNHYPRIHNITHRANNISVLWLSINNPWGYTMTSPFSRVLRYTVLSEAMKPVQIFPFTTTVVLRLQGECGVGWLHQVLGLGAQWRFPGRLRRRIARRRRPASPRPWWCLRCCRYAEIYHGGVGEGEEGWDDEEEG